MTHRRAIALLTFTLFCTSVHAEEEFFIPEEIRAFDVPCDKGHEIGLSWRRAGWEFEPLRQIQEVLWHAPWDYQQIKEIISAWQHSKALLRRIKYVVYIGRSEDGPFYEVARFDATANFMSDYPARFGPDDRNKYYHVFMIDPSTVPEFAAPTAKVIEHLTASIQEIEGLIERSKQARGVLEVWRSQGEPMLSPAEIKELEAKLKELKGKREEAERKLREEIRTIRSATYYFKLGITDGVTEIQSDQNYPIQAKGDLYDVWKSNNLFFVVLVCTFVLVCIARARRNPNVFLRRISGLDALEEAVGRATEMGRPIFYMTGRLGLHEGEKSVSTLAATIILSEVARKVAEYECDLIVPHTDPIVATLCQEIIKEAYISAGRPDAYNPSNNFFITTDQFSYTASVNGLMLREKPGAVIYMGHYYAESLLLAETGASTGAIQVAGTDAETQIPFFITACDHTLIGEELYAASAYISRDPSLVGTLRGQDMGKAAILVSVLIGTVLSTFGIDFVKKFLFFCA